MKIRVEQEFTVEDDMDPRACAIRALSAEHFASALEAVLAEVRRREKYTETAPESWDEVRQMVAYAIGEEVLALLNS